MSKPTRLARFTEPQITTMDNLVICIDEDDDPMQAMAQLEAEIDNGARNFIRKALLAKAVDNGRTFLMHAAARGNKRWFLALVSKIIAPVSVVSMAIVVFPY